MRVIMNDKGFDGVYALGANMNHDPDAETWDAVAIRLTSPFAQHLEVTCYLRLDEAQAFTEELLHAIKMAEASEEIDESLAHARPI